MGQTRAKRVRIGARLFVLLTALMLLVACSRSSAQPSVAPTPTASDQLSRPAPTNTTVAHALPAETAPLTSTRPLSSTSDLTATLELTHLLQRPLSETVVLSTTAAPSDTQAITAALDGLILVPTPTPPDDPQPIVQPTPDGVARTVRVPILMYHYLSAAPVGADIYRQDLSVPPELFARHLDTMLAEGYTTINLSDLVDYLATGRPLPDKPVVITFDDGYRDNYENAFPLLAERGMSATFFVITDFMDEQRPDYLTWEMARAMLAGGMMIESHGRNHVSLAGKDDDYLVWQALGSRETIEYELGVRPRFVSYPAGDYDQRTLALFASAGYWAGLTTVQGATHQSDHLFELPRVRMRSTTTPDELSRLLALDW